MARFVILALGWEGSSMRIEAFARGTYSVNAESTADALPVNVASSAGAQLISSPLQVIGSGQAIYSFGGSNLQSIFICGAPLPNSADAAASVAPVRQSAVSISMCSQADQVPSVAEWLYGDVSETLACLASDETSDDWRINEGVYITSLQVASILSERNIPAPSVFSNDTDSVVFNWSTRDQSLYLTITDDQLFLLCSNPTRIQYRGELKPVGGDLGFVDFLGVLESEKSLLPGEIAA
ncbi:hypothetical protein [Bradyrhizobium sp. SZCCHNRI1002]|uniref:hypothetical protein n=2 Tax=Bradyrhizobium TaxID=374 RepID=UPI0028E2AD06|nr:hypothetical protein [Bradyrhizobium sp. SZCCHNRI1002]